MIINDVFFKDGVKAYKNGETNPEWLDFPNERFRSRRLGAELLYAFMHEHKLLVENAIWCLEYENEKIGKCIEFSIDTQCLEPYKAELLSAPVPVSSIVKTYVWPEPEREPSVCKYCGAVTIASSMSTYRDNCGCVGSSWECSYCNALNLASVSSIAEVRKRDGAIEAQRIIRDIFIGETNK